MLDGFKDRTAIVGIGQTRFGGHPPGRPPEHPVESGKELACRAVLAALEDAGIDPGEVDALASYTLEETDEVELAAALGLGDLTWFSRTGYGGGGSCATVAQLAAAIAAGQATVGVAWRSRRRGPRGRPWQAPGAAAEPRPGPAQPRQGGERQPVAAQWTRPFGLLRPADEVAMLTRRYLHEYGATRDHLFNVALACRNRANQNPAAIMYERPLTREMYMDARWISEPLCLYDNCLDTDGALACVVVGAERARDCPRRPVLVHAATQSLPPLHHGMVDYWCEDPLASPGWTAAHTLWKNADLTPEEIDCAQMADAFTPQVLFTLEAYGFCGRGEGGAFTEGGALELGGRLPVNTGGGGLSEGYLHGFNHITEAVRQLRGDSTAQVPGASSALVTAGECVPTSALILRAGEGGRR
ncbi:thiolase C-terminal domain-containing protein [Phaeacidiphilus oryzae]|uniref:thiolase C-terminal domain-containing protein n=1 Tax=Phaeacidiphilus oryzae TaxID=348818 RepID=UPI00055B0B23|nr:lipid-transfer protein [Phaeacidiphilus oryzae]